eukprot:CFRG3209T1
MVGHTKRPLARDKTNDKVRNVKTRTTNANFRSENSDFESQEDCISKKESMVVESRMEENTDDQNDGKEEEESDDDNDQTKIFNQQDKNETACAGIIGKITLRNFMCHEFLEVKLGPCINFITGNNGSGKSAILTGLSVCLGASSKLTNRATNIKGFIMSGKQKCTVTVEIVNRGPETFRYAEFGDVIIVERSISQASASQYCLRSGINKKVISRKRDDLTEILDHFSIQIDNPVQILTQDTSREFLTKDDPTEKYNFFFMATQLMRLENDYNLVKEHLGELEILSHNFKTASNRLKREVKEAEEKVEAAQKLRSLQNELHELTNHFAWAKVVDARKEYQQCQSILEDTKSLIPQHLAEINNIDIEKKQLSARKKEVSDSLTKMLEEHTTQFNENHNMLANWKQYRNEIKLLKAQKMDLEAEINSNNTDITNLVGRIKILQDKKNVIKPKTDPIDHLIEQEEHTIRKLAQKMEDLNRTSGRNNVDQEHLSEQIDTLKVKRQEIEREFQSSKHRYDAARAAQKNSVDVWGRGISQVVELINKNLTKFVGRHPPIGPIGMFINLTDKIYGVAVEAAIGSYMDNFLVDNSTDAKMVNIMIAKVFSNSALKNCKRPTVLKCETVDAKYKIDTTRSACESFPAIVDLLEVGNVQAYNCLLEYCSIETTIIVPNRSDALKAARHGYRNVKKVFDMSGAAISDDAHFSNTKRMAPRFQADHASIIEESERKLNVLAEDKNALNVEINRLSKDLARLHSAEKEATSHMMRFNKEKGQSQKRLSKYQSQKEDQEHSDEEENFDVSIASYQTKIGNLEAHIQELMIQVQDVDEKIERKNQNNKDYTAELMKMKQDEKERETRQNASKSELNQIGNKLHHLNEKQGHYNTKILETEKKIDQLESDVIAAKKLCEDARVSAVSACPEEIEVNEFPDVLEVKILGKRRALEKQERIQGRVVDIEMNLIKKRKERDDAIKSFKSDAHVRKIISDMLYQRNARFESWKNTLRSRVKQRFIYLLDKQNFRGKVNIQHNSRKLTIKVEPKAENDEIRKEGTKTLSGGERSFSLVCFLISVWDAMDCPFRALDEFDVYMDMANRKLSMGLLEDVALTMKNRQFIFITPQTMEGQHEGPYKRIIKIAPPVRGQARITDFT